MEGFADIDVAEASYALLIEKRRLEACASAIEQSRQSGWIYPRLQRLQPDTAHTRMTIQFRARDHEHETEPTWIVVDDARAIRHFEDDMIMSVEARNRPVKSRGRARILLRLDAERTTHAKVGDEHVPARKPKQQVLCAAVDALDRMAGHPSAEIGRYRKPEIAPIENDPGYGLSRHGRRQAPTGRFHFRKFRH